MLTMWTVFLTPGSNIKDSLSEDDMAMTVGFAEIGCVVFTLEVIPYVYAVTLEWVLVLCLWFLLFMSW